MDDIVIIGQQQRGRRAETAQLFVHLMQRPVRVAALEDALHPAADIV